MQTLTIGEKPLGPRAAQVMSYAFEHPNDNQTKIAKHFGLTSTRISAIMRSNRYSAAMPRMAKTKIRGMIPKATHKYERLLTQNVNLEVARKVSTSILESEKILEVSPTMQINVMQGLSDEELKIKIADSLALPTRSIEGELA